MTPQLCEIVCRRGFTELHSKKGCVFYLVPFIFYGQGELEMELKWEESTCQIAKKHQGLCSLEELCRLGKILFSFVFNSWINVIYSSVFLEKCKSLAFTIMFVLTCNNRCKPLFRLWTTLLRPPAQMTSRTLSYIE